MGILWHILLKVVSQVTDKAASNSPTVLIVCIFNSCHNICSNLLDEVFDLSFINIDQSMNDQESPLSNLLIEIEYTLN